MSLTTDAIAQAHSLLQQSESYSIEHIADRLAWELGKPREEVRKWIPELKKWLILAAVNPKGQYSVFGPVDRLWHEFIIFTLEYEQFCSGLFGEFIHHVPEVKIGPKEGGNVEVSTIEGTKYLLGEHAKRYERFLLDYIECFGTGLDPDFDPNTYPPFGTIWPIMNSAGVHECEGGCCKGGCACGCGGDHPLSTPV